jgi:hypothetical protein
MDSGISTDYRNCTKTGKKKIPEKSQFNCSADIMYAPVSEVRGQRTGDHEALGTK